MRKLFALLLLCGSLYGGNKMLVTDNGLEMFEWDLKFIAQAEQSIEVSGCFCGGTIFQQLCDALEARMVERPQIKVHVHSSPTLLKDADHVRIDELLQKYPEQFHFQLSSNVLQFFPDFSGVDNHVKCVVIDELYYSAGGTNLDEVLCSDGKYTPVRPPKSGLVDGFTPAGTRDGDVVGKGDAAKRLRKIFFGNFALWEDYFDHNCDVLQTNPALFEENNRYWELDAGPKADIPEFDTHSDVVEVGDVKVYMCNPHQKVNCITYAYENMLRDAKSDVWIANLYFNPQGKILDESLAAINRGVSFTLLTNGIHERGLDYAGTFCWASRMQYVPLFHGRHYHMWQVFDAIFDPVKKTQIYEYGVKDILYHKKVMVVDRKKILIGSYNLGLKSHIADYELALVIDSPDLAEKMLEVLEVDKALSVPVLPKEAREWYFNPLTAYLGGVQKQFHGFL